MTKFNDTLKAWRRKIGEKIPLLQPLLYACSFKEVGDKPIQTLDGSVQQMTLCVNTQTLEVMVNPAFTATQTEQDNLFALSHEMLHVLLRHGPRRATQMAKEGEKKFDAEKWQYCEEEACNETAVALSGWPAPKGCVQPGSKTFNMSVEQKYAYYKAHPQDFPRKKCVTKCYICLGKGDGNSAANEKARQEIEKIIKEGGAVELVVDQSLRSGLKQLAKDKANGKLAGDMPGELIELASAYEPLKAPLNWREKLSRFLTSMDASCKEFDPRTLYRRSLAQRGMMYPNLSSHPIVNRFGLLIDNSGSVDDSQFAEFVGAVQDCADKLGFTEAIVYHFTTVVMKKERYFNMRELQKLRRVACGGTDMMDADIKAKEDRCQFAICLTDGYLNWPAAFSLPTLIVLTENGTLPPETTGNMLGCFVLGDAK